MTWGAIQGNGYVSQFFHWLNTTFPPRPGRPPHALLNRGVGGATSSLFSTCTNHFVPADADLVVVEFAHNDGAQVFCGGKMSGACGGGLVHSVAPGCAQRASWMQTRARGWLWRNSAAPAAWSGVLLQSAVRCTKFDPAHAAEYERGSPADPFDSAPRREYEVLLRRLLRLSSRPAVVLLNYYNWWAGAAAGAAGAPDAGLWRAAGGLQQCGSAAWEALRLGPTPTSNSSPSPVLPFATSPKLGLCPSGRPRGARWSGTARSAWSPARSGGSTT